MCKSILAMRRRTALVLEGTWFLRRTNEELGRRKTGRRFHHSQFVLRAGRSRRDPGCGACAQWTKN
ncbi:hypothetical protein SBV1_40008 [Verrucomicrobia bacterium]|nr:hypothetical protein SBV1_40008 [Verrucomicrobiota bacterium]